MTSTLLLAMLLPSGDLTPQTLDVVVPVKLNYLLSLPKDYDERGDASFPLVLFLHGFGESGDNLELVKKHGPPKQVAAGREFPFILVAPQNPKGRWWQPVELIALLDEIEANHRVDADRIYVTGLSMGGYGTWNLAGMAPERLAAVAPICGGGNGVLTRYVGELPIWAFHGADDPVVSPVLSQMLVDQINRRGGDAKLTLYPGVQHDSWTQTYDDPEFYEWLLSKRLSDRVNE